MRPRKKAHLPERLAACAPLIIASPEEKRGALRGQFPSPSAPLHLELGCGKGRFICEQAARTPDVNFLALEREENVAITGLERAMAAQPPLPNLRFLLADATRLDTMFLPGELSRIYIHFCDPWHKHSQYKRRLTWRGNLETYRKLLAPGGELWFKTDNYMLYHFSLHEFHAALPYYFKTADLHKEPEAQSDIMTEYEAHFSELGQPIYAIRARKPCET